MSEQNVAQAQAIFYLIRRGPIYLGEADARVTDTERARRFKQVEAEQLLARLNSPLAKFHVTWEMEPASAQTVSLPLERADVQQLATSLFRLHDLLGHAVPGCGEAVRTKELLGRLRTRCVAAGLSDPFAHMPLPVSTSARPA